MISELKQSRVSLDATIVGRPVVRPVRPGSLLPQARAAVSPMDDTALGLRSAPRPARAASTRTQTTARPSSASKDSRYFFLQPSSMPLTFAQRAVCMTVSLVLVMGIFTAIGQVPQAERRARARTTSGRIGGKLFGVFTLVVAVVGYGAPRRLFQHVNFVEGSRIEVGSRTLTVPGFLVGKDESVTIPRGGIAKLYLQWVNGALTGLNIELTDRTKLWFPTNGFDTNIQAVADTIWRMMHARPV